MAGKDAPSTGTVTVERLSRDRIRVWLRAVAGEVRGDASFVVKRGEEGFDDYEPLAKENPRAAIERDLKARGLM